MRNFSVFSYTLSDLRRMPPRTPRSHKGTYGRAVLICGSEGMAGAAYLCGKAAYRTGAGLVEIVTPEANRAILQTLLPEAVLTIYDETPEGLENVKAAVERADALCIGCGLGTSSRAYAALKLALSLSRGPTVLDGDALNLIALTPSLFPYLKHTVITPHPAEMARLAGRSIDHILFDPPTVAQAFAAKYRCICVLKDHETVIANGSARVYRNTSGNSGMATGGSGDVLAGILTGIFSQKKTDLTPMDTAALAVYLHGLCGDEAANALSEYSVMASDLIDALPKVLRRL